MALAFFDLDGTLTHGDTFILYCLIALAHRPARALRLGPVFKSALAYKRKRIGRKELKESVVRAALKGAGEGEIRQWNRVLLKAVFPRITRTRVLQRLHRHQERGDRVYMVSASPDIYVRPIGELLGVNGVMCTALEVENSRLTGRIDGENCRAEEKARRIRALFTEAELEGSSAYGNSEGDRQMLDLVRFGYRV